MAAKAEDRPVLVAIAKIMSEVGSVEKKGRNDFHKYNYATAADIAYALQKRMSEAGLIIIPSQVKFDLLVDNSLLAIEFEFMVEHTSGDKLEDRPRFTGMSSIKNSKGGVDDKAANKCLTAAAKYFVLNLFRIPTGDYHDADNDEEQSAPILPEVKGKNTETPFDEPAEPSAASVAYVNACEQVIGMTDDRAELGKWWRAEHDKRVEYKLNKSQVEGLKDMVVMRGDELEQAQKETAA